MSGSNKKVYSYEYSIPLLIGLGITAARWAQTAYQDMKWAEVHAGNPEGSAFANIAIAGEFVEDWVGQTVFWGMCLGVAVLVRQKRTSGHDGPGSASSALPDAHPNPALTPARELPNNLSRSQQRNPDSDLDLERGDRDALTNTL
jgi:hypothetical protein